MQKGEVNNNKASFAFLWKGCNTSVFRESEELQTYNINNNNHCNNKNQEMNNNNMNKNNT